MKIHIEVEIRSLIFSTYQPNRGTHNMLSGTYLFIDDKRAT